MPHKFFDNQNAITLDDLTTAVMQQQQSDLPMPAPLATPSQGPVGALQSTQTLNSNNINITPDPESLSNNTSQNNLNLVLESSQNQDNEEIIMEIDTEKIKYYEKHIHLHDDISNRQCILRDINMKVDQERKCRFNDILYEIEKREPFFEFLNRDNNVLFFVYDPSRKMFVHLPYNSYQDTFILFDFLQDQDYLKIKFREVQKQNNQSEGEQEQEIGERKYQGEAGRNYQNECQNSTHYGGAPPTSSQQQQISDEEMVKQKENQIREKFFEELRLIEPMKREKERSIGFAQENVRKWRNYLENGVLYMGVQVKLNLNQAAQYLGIRRKTLDEYYKQIKEGIQKGFNFEEQQSSKIGVLRKFNKDNKNIVFNEDVDYDIIQGNGSNSKSVNKNQKKIKQQERNQAEINMVERQERIQYQQQDNDYQYDNNNQSQPNYINQINNEHTFNNTNTNNNQLPINNGNSGDQSYNKDIEKYDEELALQVQLEQFSDQEDYPYYGNNNAVMDNYNQYDDFQGYEQNILNQDLMEDISRVQQKDNQEFYGVQKENSLNEYFNNNNHNNSGYFNKSMNNSFQINKCDSYQSFDFNNVSGGSNKKYNTNNQNQQRSFSLENCSSPCNMSIQSCNNNSNQQQQQENNQSYFFAYGESNQHL